MTRKKLLSAATVACIVLAASFRAACADDASGSTDPAPAVVAQPAVGITVSVEPDGRYTVEAADFGWKFAGKVRRPVSAPVVSAGADDVGEYGKITFSYSVGGAAREVSIRAYAKRPVVVFAEKFADAGDNTRHFPHLRELPPGLWTLGYAGWSFAFGGAAEPGSPRVFFDADKNTFVLSPADHFTVAQMALSDDGTRVAVATDPTIETLPAGFTHETILVVGRGVGATLTAWGSALTDLAGKVRPANDADITLRQVGYWTDNGARYYYDPGEDASPARRGGTNLVAVRDDLARRGIPAGYFQLDSWWYPKGNPASWRNRLAGIFRLRHDPELFGDGLVGLRQRLGMVPLVVHSRYWSADSPDRAEYAFSGDVPVDWRYWRDLAAYLVQSGVAVYEQDWLSDRARTDANTEDPDAFFGDMAQELAARGITMQYCMPKTAHFLQGTKYSNLTSIRVSEDGFGRNQWDGFLFISHLAAAIGIWPFTDNIRSGDVRSVLLATLSAGPVGIADAVGAANAANLAAVGNAAGVFKPDAPIVPTDDTYLAWAQGQTAAVVASTATDLGTVKAAYVFAYAAAPGFQSVSFSADEVGIPAGRYASAFVYDYFSQEKRRGVVVPTGFPVTPTVGENGSYFVIVPVGDSGMAFLGETAKFVPLAKRRFAAADDDGTAITATLTFTPEETSVVVRVMAPARPAVASSVGAARLVAGPSPDNLYDIVVSPSSGGTAVIKISR